MTGHAELVVRLYTVGIRVIFMHAEAALPDADLATQTAFFIPQYAKTGSL